MRLRRIMENVRALNWIAVAVDFIVVVAGILIAFQINEWNERRIERAKAESYLQRMDRDLETDAETFNRRIGFWANVSRFGKSALVYSQTDDAPSSYWNIVLAFFQASQAWEFNSTRSTFDEMTSAGDLDLIRNLKTRGDVANYYANSHIPALSEFPRYREDVRGVIPIDIQDYIWRRCYATTGADTNFQQKFLACEAPVPEERAREIAQSLRANSTLISELTYWMSTVEIATQIAHARLDQIDKIRAEIQSDLGKTRDAKTS